MDFTKELEEGKYTGTLTKKVVTENFIISTTQYLKSNCETRLHSHKNQHICFLYLGADIECGENEVRYQRKAGDLYFYDSGEPHRTVSTTKNSKNVNIELRNNALLNKGDLRTTLENHPNANILCLKILQEVHLNDNLTHVSLEQLCSQLIYYFDKDTSRFRPDWACLLKEFLNDNWQETFSLLELAGVAGVHPVTISKNFRKYFNCSYREYVRKLKIKNSIRFIKNSKLSLTEISLHCGFSDQSHFTRNFKQQTNFLPKILKNL